RSCVHFSNTSQCVIYRLLLKFQLRVITHVLPLATSTNTKMRTERLDAIRRCLIYVRDTTFCKILFLTLQFYINDITRNSFFDKKHQFLVSSYTFALFSNVENLNILKLFFFLWYSSAHRVQKYTF